MVARVGRVGGEGSEGGGEREGVGGKRRREGERSFANVGVINLIPLGGNGVIF